MIGDRLVMQESLFFQFRLDDHVPADHMLRAIYRFLDLDRLRRNLARPPPGRSSATTRVISDRNFA